MALAAAARDEDFDEVRRIMAEDNPSAEDLLATVDNEFYDEDSNALEMIIVSPELDSDSDLPMVIAKAMVEAGVLSHRYAGGWNTFQRALLGAYNEFESCPDHGSYDPPAFVYMVQNLALDDLVHEGMGPHPVGIAGVLGMPQLFNVLVDKLDPSSFLDVEQGIATAAHVTVTASTRESGEYYDSDYKPILDRLLPMLGEGHLYHRDENGDTVLESADDAEPCVILSLSTLLEHLPDAAFGNDENPPPLLKYAHLFRQPEFQEDVEVTLFKEFIARTPGHLLLQKDEDGNTVLHHAVEGDNAPLTKAILLSAPSAIKHVENNEGKTPVSLAEESDDEAVIALLASGTKRAE